MKHALLALATLSTLTACGSSLPFGRDRADAPPIAVTEEPGDDVTRPRARTGDEAEAPRPAPAPAADGFLGETLAGLGAPGEAGLWLRTGLVSEVQRGRVETEAGNALTLDLRPSGADAGSGSHLSLAAMQALGLPLNGLAALRVSIAP
jgi:predicted small lipoprotein YifL